MSAARSETSVDNELIRITTWTFDAGGANTGHHIHEYDYVVVPVTGGTFTIVDADGRTHEMTQQAGAAYLGTARTAHDVVASGPAVFVEIELKR
jgi:beta-alanine degradation protein BauB